MSMQMIIPKLLSSRLHHQYYCFPQNPSLLDPYRDKLHKLYNEHEISLEVVKSRHCAGGLTTLNSINQYEAAKGSLSPCRCLLNGLGIDVSFWLTRALCSLTGMMNANGKVVRE
ncbi:hypothetical protein CEXT_12001 [Caerostris extrusa]|uniref:Uncharacterized protein n=1 Tax=Caerostris extrusa TaxID=172846 RepID=A0AAV4Y8X1_CAEEX|nr:hypothetical protein CEXT_12001 [Caerostris extrusa]